MNQDPKNPNEPQQKPEEPSRFIEGELTEEELKQITGGRRGFRLRSRGD